MGVDKMLLLRHSLCLLLVLGVVVARRGGGFRSGGGGGWFSRGSSSRSSSSRSGGWFGSRGSSNKAPASSSYPKQQWGSSSSISRSGSSGSLSRTNSVGSSRSSIGGGGFVNPKTNTFKTNPYGTKQYSGWSKPLGATAGVHSFKGQKYGYRTPGYGTRWGTNFAGGAGRYSKGYSGKALGLGVAAGFLGGAALSTMGTMAMYSVYHRYNMYMMMMHMNNPMMYGYNRGYYNNYYGSNICRDGCPMNAHCEWGFCECNAGTTRKNGQCVDPFVTCSETSSCAKMDMNLVCNTNLTTGGNLGKCQCRQDMKWNAEAGECQLFLDVDCSSITYESQPSKTILD